MAEFTRSQHAEPRGLNRDQLQEFLAWQKPLQQALSLESERGCSNLQGRQQRHWERRCLDREALTPWQNSLDPNTLNPGG